jgi:hypothetical protein
MTDGAAQAHKARTEKQIRRSFLFSASRTIIAAGSIQTVGDVYDSYDLHQIWSLKTFEKLFKFGVAQY